jgi:hypothetical protein
MPVFAFKANQMSEPQAQPKPYIASGTLGSLAVEGQFKDGPHIVPDWVVLQLGGKEAFERDYLPEFRKLNFAEFMHVHLEEASKQKLQLIQQTIINQHFNRINNPWQ